MEGEVFKDEILAGTESTNNPTDEVPEAHDHGKNLIETSSHRLISTVVWVFMATS